jgi:hypothetical protein
MDLVGPSGPAIGGQEDGRSVDHLAAALLPRKSWHKRMDRERLHQVHKRFPWVERRAVRRQEDWRLAQVPREQQEPGSSSFQLAVERVLSLLATKRI